MEQKHKKVVFIASTFASAKKEVIEIKTLQKWNFFENDILKNKKIWRLWALVYFSGPGFYYDQIF